MNADSKFPKEMLRYQHPIIDYFHLCLIFQDFASTRSMEILVKFVLCRHFKVNFAESCKTRIFRFKDQKGHSEFYKDSALSPFYLYSAKWGFQFYPLSLYILSNGVFSSIPFLYCQMGFSVSSPFSTYSGTLGFQFYPLSTSSVTILVKTRRRVFARQKRSGCYN